MYLHTHIERERKRERDLERSLGWRRGSGLFQGELKPLNPVARVLLANLPPFLFEAEEETTQSVKNQPLRPV